MQKVPRSSRLRNTFFGWPLTYNETDDNNNANHIDATATDNDNTNNDLSDGVTADTNESMAVFELTRENMIFKQGL